MFCLQETHLSKEGSVKFEGEKNYQLFEKIRESKSGGGLVIGALKDLNPIWLGDGEKDVEALSIKISVTNMDIRVVNAYGPQEYDDIVKKTKFWKYLDNEIFQADKEGNGCLITMDGNAWLGDKIIKDDPHKQNKNGEMLQHFLQRNPNLTLLNREKFCQGVITRSRTVSNKIESSIIDFVIVCDKVFPYITKFTIDEQKKYALANYSSKGKITYSDHNSLITEMNIQFNKMKPERRTVYNFKNQEGLSKFRALTSIKGSFSNFFNLKLTFKKQIKLWKQKLKFTVEKCFRKVRLRKTKKYKCKIFSKRKSAISNENADQKNEAELDLKKEEAENNLKRIQSNIDQLNNKCNGKQNNIWKIKKKFFPKSKSAVPVAKFNLSNKIITDPTNSNRFIPSIFNIA